MMVRFLGHGVTTLSEHIGPQAGQEQVLCRERVCVCDELQSCCKHAASSLTVHPRVQMLLLTRPSALLQTGTTSKWMCGENMEQQMQQERRAMLLLVVSGISDAANGERCGFRFNLRCHIAQEHGKCECGGLKTGSASARLQHTNYAARVFAGGPQSGALRVKRWLHRVVKDASCPTFEEWDPIKDADDSQTPVPMIIDPSEFHGAGFYRQEVIPAALEAAARSGRRTRGAGLRQLESMGRKRFVLSADDDNKLRSRCE